MTGITGQARMKLKSECCKKYKKKGKACESCPLMAGLSRKQRKKVLGKARKKLAKAA